MPRTKRSDYAHPRIRQRRGGRLNETSAPAQGGESKGVSWINAVSAGIGAIIAIPALILALLAYIDTKDDKEEGDVKEAAQVSWYELSDSADTAKVIALENRSLRPVYDAIVVLYSEDGRKAEQAFYIDDTNSPCTRTIYRLTESQGKGVRSGLLGRMYFRDTLRNWWRTGYDGGLINLTEKGWSFEIEDLRKKDKIAEWGITPEYEDLTGCG
ncbi:hypothetical protein [Streptomyces sp. NPDC053541]|uniref:hypothetical protein n=1 Tax=Streptomyces sp. NPDC053541 TaxID=3365709 RepID=UPI0037CEAB73